MKKLFISILMLLPIFAQAQNVLTPQQQLEQAQKQLEKAKKAVEEAQKAQQAAEEEAKKAAKDAAEAARIQEQIRAAKEEAAKLNAEAERINAETKKKKAEKQDEATNKGWEIPTAVAPTKTTKTNANGETVKDNPKYLADVLTFDTNGKISFTMTTDANGKSAAQIYNLVYHYMNELTQGKNNIASRVALINKDKNIIANTMDEWLVFNNSFISLDRTEFKYTLIATIKDDNLQVTLNRISYVYEAGRSTGFKDTAENVISDKMALNKRKTALAKIYGKFRRCTIDRKEQIFNDLKTLVKQ